MSSIAAIEETAFSNYTARQCPLSLLIPKLKAFSLPDSVLMTFENSNKSAISGSAADSEWKSFFPSNNGFLVKSVENNTVFFGISAFHAIHCLDTVRRILEMHYNVASVETINKFKEEPADATFYHIHHCLIYLREMLTCNADPTLEHDMYYENGTEVRGGDGTKHMCRDFKALYDISEESDKAARSWCGVPHL
ncbi:hypothetical protein K435DRAFT_661638 [Dendrothele bispora CBS 962.96]|uniref:Uncharacterized protein n=1 Tax=Dendrothele bispora (strain CBS 962.96) TaxID=1314807 RepID=A0A4S8M7P6_DENBC|nr:hypothetical protein K435DRAFT_661638 [Dendrothele bispora CBS 962.96]